MGAVAIAADRSALYARLVRRNRLVAVLRIAVPLAGALMLVLLVAGIVLGSLTNRFGFASIHIDRNNMVVDAPRLAATAPNGNSYSFSAREARAAMDALDTIEVSGGLLSMRTPDGRDLSARYDKAAFETDDQIVTIHGTANVSSNDGTKGTVDDVVWNVPQQMIQSSGALDVTLPKGQQIKAASMTYDAQADVWHFSRVEVTLPDLPGGPE